MAEPRPRTGIESKKRYKFSVLERALKGELSTAEERYLKRRLKASAEEFIPAFSLMTELAANNLALEDAYE